MRKTASIFMIIAAFFIATDGKAQDSTANESDYIYPESFHVLYQTVFNGEAIPSFTIPEIEVVEYKLKDAYERSHYNRTKSKLEKVYPYFLIAQELIEDVEQNKDSLNKRAFKKYKKKKKKEMMKQFEKEIRDLKVSEGKILMKLINRETGVSFYELIDEYSSGFKMWTYEVAAKKYGYNLNEVYDPEASENKFIEMALKAYESEQFLNSP